MFRGHCWKNKLVNSVLLLLVSVRWKTKQLFLWQKSCCYVRANMAHRREAEEHKDYEGVIIAIKSSSLQWNEIRAATKIIFITD